MKATRQSWLYGWENFPEKKCSQRQNPATQRLKKGRARRLKEALRSLLGLPHRSTAEVYFRDGWAWAIRSRLARVNKAAKMLRPHLECILKYFDYRWPTIPSSV